MKKRYLLFIIIGLVVFIQVIRPTKNISKDFTNDYTTAMDVPMDVQEIIKTSCADCHSNYTQYPWYAEIAPVSWYLAEHVNDGKEHLNFSEWNVYNNEQKNHVIDEIEEVLNEHEMPLESYIWIHKEAALTSIQHQKLIDWIASIK